eukprot:753585-Hanusia_phi.AAC.2
MGSFLNQEDSMETRIQDLIDGMEEEDVAGEQTGSGKQNSEEAERPTKKAKKGTKKDPAEPKKAKATKDPKPPKESSKEPKKPKEPKEPKDPKEPKEPKPAKVPKAKRPFKKVNTDTLLQRKKDLKRRIQVNSAQLILAQSKLLKYENELQCRELGLADDEDLLTMALAGQQQDKTEVK